MDAHLARVNCLFPFFHSFLFFFLFSFKRMHTRSFFFVSKVGHEFFLPHYTSAEAHPCFPIMAYLTHQPPALSISCSLGFCVLFIDLPGND